MFLQLSVTREMMYDDAFSVQAVSEENVYEMNQVAGFVPLLLKIGHDLSNNLLKIFDQRSTNRIEQVAFLVQSIRSGHALKIKKRILGN